MQSLGAPRRRGTARMRHRRLHILAVAALLSAVAGLHALAGPLVGNATSIVKEVKGKTEAELRVLVVNDDVFHDEEITTGTHSATKLLFKDNTSLTMGEASRMKLTKVVFDPDPSKSAVAVKATQGVFRMSTGRLPSAAYRIDTPVATIGVRGTVIEFTVGADGATTLYVATGAAFVTVDRPSGREQVLVPMGQATTVSLGPDGLPTPPSPPAPPSSGFVEQVRLMTMLVQMSGALGDIQTGAGGNGAPTLNVNLALSNNIGFGPSNALNRNTGGPALGLGGFDLIRGTPATGMPPVQTVPPLPQIIAPPAAKKSAITTVSGPTATIAGPPIVTLDATPPPRVRIGARTDIGVNVSSSGGAASGTLGAGTGGVNGAGGGVTVPDGASTVVTYVFLADHRGPQSGSIPFSFDNPGGEGALLIDTIGVGPDFRTDLPVSGVDFLEVPVGQSRSIYFRIGNLTGDEGTLDLIGLTILGLEIVGADAQYYSVEPVVSGTPTFSAALQGPTVLGAGDILEFIITFHAPDLAGLYDDAMLRLITDQFATFGEPGLELQVGLRAVVIPEPAGLGLLGLAATLGWLATRRRR
jgi:hypothetical protein